jgi:hypothetical protein
MKITKTTDPAVTVIFNEPLDKCYKAILPVAHQVNQEFEGVLNSSVYKLIPTGNELVLAPGDMIYILDFYVHVHYYNIFWIRLDENMGL